MKFRDRQNLEFVAKTPKFLQALKGRGVAKMEDKFVELEKEVEGEEVGEDAPTIVVVDPRKHLDKEQVATLKEKMVEEEKVQFIPPKQDKKVVKKKERKNKVVKAVQLSFDIED
jgi:hypothetical protein